MQIDPFPFPFSPFESPVHALILVIVGVLFWMVGKGNRLVASQPKKVRWLSRHNALHAFVHGRSTTVAEQRTWMPDGHFRVYGLFGVVGQWIGYAVGSIGLVCFAIAIAKIF
ncbi:hypothetical protein [Roseovarius sp. Pro17]|uniref:hypothetical protein n=1 Tax=Roseovarius sp. Pro17 TaxID=3108175 RepID=UPI002D7847EE|nr:hypothetical protein [Roseovarius sp. Pro17]